jgi:hypothetical protein
VTSSASAPVQFRNYDNARAALSEAITEGVLPAGRGLRFRKSEVGPKDTTVSWPTAKQA